jgi:hypothetical protein
VVALWQLNDNATTDVVYLTSSGGTTPTLSGFGPVGIIGYVYPTQICGSVPLHATTGPGDHWYTTDLIELNGIVGQTGWTDDGIAAYVVPL